jgi:hypothetical protein
MLAIVVPIEITCVKIVGATLRIDFGSKVRFLILD